MERLKENRQPLHTQVANYLTKLVESSEYDAGDRFPSEVEMAAQIGVSRSTLREALRTLEQRGLIVRKHGVGTFVARGYDRRLESGLERLESVLSLAREEHLHVDVEALEVHEQPASRGFAERLRMPKAAPVTVVRRVLTVEEGPLAYLVDSVPRSILAREDLPASFDGSVLDLLLRDPDLYPDRAVAHIVPLVATPSLSQKLDVEVGEPLLLLEETLFGQGGQPLGASRNYFVPGFFNFSVVRRRV